MARLRSIPPAVHSGSASSEQLRGAPSRSRFTRSLLKTNVEENRFVLSLQNNVPFQFVFFSVDLSGDEGSATTWFPKIEHEILIICRFFREINSCHKTPQQSAHEHRDDNVRGLLSPVWPWHRARLDCCKPKCAIRVGRDPSKSLKSRFGCLVLGVIRMRVFSRAVRLPDLQHRVRDAISITVDHAPGDFDALARNTSSCEVNLVQAVAADRKKGSDGLRGCGAKAHFISHLAAEAPTASLHARPERDRTGIRALVPEWWSSNRTPKSIAGATFRPPCN